MTATPDDVAARRDLAVALWNSGDAAGAEREADALVKQAPDDAPSHELLSWLLMRTKTPQAARAHATTAVRLAPESWRALSQEAVSALLTGDARGARETAEKLAAVARERAGPRELLGHIALHEARWTDAIREYEAALGIDERSYAALVGKGLALDRVGQYADAARAFLAAIKLEPTDPAAYIHHHEVVGRVISTGRVLVFALIFVAIASLAVIDPRAAITFAIPPLLFALAAAAFIWRRRRLRRLPHDAIPTLRRDVPDRILYDAGWGVIVALFGLVMLPNLVLLPIGGGSPVIAAAAVFAAIRWTRAVLARRKVIVSGWLYEL